MENNNALPRMKATYRGRLIGWYDTLAEAQAAIAAAQRAEQTEQADLERQLFGAGGCHRGAARYGDENSRAETMDG